LPQSGTQTATLTPGGGNDLIIEIPIKAFNLARSFLEFTVAPAANPAAALGTYKDVITSIRQVQLSTRSGVYMADVQELPNYSKTALKAEIPFQEYNSYDEYSGGVGIGRYLRANNALGAANDRPQDASTNLGNYTETQYYERGGNTTQTPVHRICLPLGMIKNTIFSLDKDIYAGEILVLRIVWNATNRIFWNKADSAVPTAGVTVFDGNATITNIALFLAVEKNPQIENQLKAQIASGGLNILIPYLYAYKNTLGPRNRLIEV